MKRASCLLALAGLLMVPALALASPTVLNLDNPSAGFSNPVPVTSTTDSDFHWPDGVNGDEIRFGNPSNSANQQSGLRFDVFDAPMNAAVGSAFRLGTLTHYNFTVGTGTSITGVDLTFGFDIANVPISLSYLFNLGVDETDNSGNCAYPSTTPCADKISFPDMTGDHLFTMGGTQYVLSLLGFGDDAADIQHDFITQEGVANTTGLWAVVNPRTDTGVPEPGVLFSMGLGLLGLAGLLFLRRREHDPGRA